MRKTSRVVVRTPAKPLPAGRIAPSAVSSHSFPSERTAKQGEPPPWDRVLEIAKHQLDQFASLESKVLKGDDPDAIHDLRVASRRLQQVLDLLYPSPYPPKIRKLRRTIRRSRRSLSLVRNCDVLMGRVERVLARKRISRPAAWAVFRDYLRERRDGCFRKASRRLSNLNLPAFYVRLKGHLQSPDNPPEGGESSASTEVGDGKRFRGRIDKALGVAWSALESGVAQAQETRNAAGLHPVRIAAKKFRYLIEVIHQLGAPGSDQALVCLRHLQQQLGNWHDLEVLEQMMLEMVARRGFLQDRLPLAMEVERLVLRNRRNKKLHEEKFFQMTGETGQWRRLADWVHDFLLVPPAHARTGKAPTLQPSHHPGSDALGTPQP